MNLFRNRPLCLGAALFLVTAIFCLFLPFVAKLAFLICLLVAGILLLLLFRRRTLAVTCLCLVCALAAGISLLAFDMPRLSCREYDGKTVEITAIVTEVQTKTDDYTCYAVRTDTVNGSRTRIRLGMFVWNDERMAVGDTFEATVSVTLYPARDYREHRYEYANALVGEAAPEDGFAVTGHRNTPVALAMSLRDKAVSYFLNSYHSDAASLMSAMLLGARTPLSPYMSNQFRRAGLAHLLALSGVHVAILCAAIRRLCSLFRLPKRATSVVILLFLLGYSLLTGLSLSILRAAVMTGVVMLGGLLRREHDSVTSLFFAAALICTFSPYALLDLGFWMSVCATFGILVIGECRERIREKRSVQEEVVPTGPRFSKLVQSVAINYLLMPVLISLSATLLTLPITCFFFSTFSPMFLPANLIFPALMTPFLYCSLLSLPVFPLRRLTDLFATGFMKLLSSFSGVSGALISLDFLPFQVLLLVFIAVLLFYLLAPLRKRRGTVRRAVAILCSLFVCMGVSLLISQLLRRAQTDITYVSSSTNDEYIILRDKGKTVLCAVTRGSYSSFRYALDELDELGEYDIELLYLPHYHPEASYTIERLLGRISVSEIAVPTPVCQYETGCCLTLERICEKYGIALTQVPADSHTVACGGVTVKALPRVVNSDGTEGTTALCAAVGNSALYYFSAGYTTSDAFEEQSPVFAPPADILIFGSHGTKKQREDPPDYPLSDATDTLLLCNPETGILLTDEEQLLFDRMTIERAPAKWYRKCN